MYNLAFRNFVDDLCLKATTGYFIGKPKELAEYQTMFRHGLDKFGMNKMDKNAVMDYLRENGIRPKGENGRWGLCGVNIGKHNVVGAAKEPSSTTTGDARNASSTTKRTGCEAPFSV
mgnify:CR=1 FL=1